MHMHKSCMYACRTWNNCTLDQPVYRFCPVSGAE